MSGDTPAVIGPKLTYPAAPALSLTAGGSSPYSGYTNGLWHMNEGSGTVIGDSSGNSNNGTWYSNMAISGAASASGTHASYNVNGPKDGQGSTTGTCPP